MTDIPAPAVLAASAPIVLLSVLVVRRQPLGRSAWIVNVVAATLATSIFGLAPPQVGIAVVRGLWTGAWILLIVLPALLLFEVLDRSGALDHLAGAADQLAPTEGRRLMLLAWVLPSFLQGAAGFGAPIAMSAPLLIRRGMAPVAAVAACLVGYQWSVTFGSMGASYFMAEATARLTGPAASEFAIRSAPILAATALLSGFLVLGRGRRSRGDRRRVAVIGLIMGAVLIAVVRAQPALGSTAAGLAGLLAAWALLPERGAERPAGAPLLVAAMPYVVLTTAATVGFAFRPVRALLERVPAVAPVLPGSEAAFGFSTAAVPMTPAFRPLLHPLPYVLLAVVTAIVTYRWRGWWPADAGRDALRSWRQRVRPVVPTILGLTVLAAIMTEAGMVTALADTLVALLGVGFAGVSAALGMFGTMLTGSTTASNALFSALQAEVAVALGLVPAIVLAGQTAGANIGNCLSPGIAAVGASAAGVSGREGEILRRNIRDALLILLAITVLVLLQVWLAR